MRGEGVTAAKAADILRVPRASLYRWKSRLRKRGLRGLEPDSRRPRSFRGCSRMRAQARGILPFVLPPHSPNLNWHVERAHRTHVEEFSDFYDGELTMGPLTRALREWEAYYNAERPHQSLGWLSPLEYLSEHRMEAAS